MDDRTAWDRATRRQRQLAVAADAELRRHHPNQPWPELRSAEPQPANATATPAPNLEEDARLVENLAAEHRKFADKLANRESIMIPAEDPDIEASVPAFPAWAAPVADAILQPPKSEITPSPRILARAADRDADIEPAS